MRTLSIILWIILLGIIPYNATAQGTGSMMFSSNGEQGKDFWIAIPPNEFGPTYPTRALEIYITSSTDANVVIEHPGSGFKKSIKVPAFQTITLNDKNGGANWAWENYESEKAVNNAIHIYSDKAIVVSELNSKSFSSDGYTALPTTVWGKDYIHVGYYDYGENPSFQADWGSGFIVIAKDNETKISIELKGKNTAGPLGRTRKGAKIGDKLTATLQSGQIYMVNGNGQTLGAFDLTGSKITANKPVGFISFHQRTMIPVNVTNNNGRDHLAEYLPPVTAWGKKFITVEFKRENRGDLFRIVASQDNTKFKCVYYDKVTGLEIGTRQGTLKKSGDYGEYDEFIFDAFNKPNPRPESIKGVCVWTADKPVMVMQYAYSASFDDSPVADPTMTRIMPVEQYTFGGVFGTPGTSFFAKNYFNLLAIGDSTDPTNAKLRTVEFADADGNWTPVFQKDPNFLSHRIPTTNIWWSTLDIGIGAHRVRSNTPVGSYIYGYNNHDGYSWPVLETINKIDDLDTLPPVLTSSHHCTEWTFVAIEHRNGLETDSIRQIDQGINQIIIDEEHSYNYALVLPKDLEPSKPEYGPFDFTLQVINPYQDGFAIFSVIDRAGNMVIDSVRYTPVLVSMNPPQIEFGNVRLGRSKQLTAYLVNPTDKEQNVDSLWLLKHQEFEIVPPLPKKIAAHDSVLITFKYTPKKEWSKDEKDIDEDSVFAKGTCEKYPLGELTGRGVMPHIQVADIDMGKVVIGDQACNTTDVYKNTLKVENTGTDTLTITSIDNVSAPFTFTFTDPPPATLPIIIPPGEYRYLKTICYSPTEQKKDKISVAFNCDAPKVDANTSEWIGEGIGSVDVLEEVDNNFQLHCQPNPVQDKVLVTYRLATSCLVHLSLFNTLGREIVMIEKAQESGEHIINLDLTGLPAGVYYCRLMTGAGTEVYPMVLMR